MAEWDEEAHPRDDKGRFGAGGGDLKTWAEARSDGRGGGGKGDLQAWAKSVARKGPNLPLAKLAGERRVWTGKTEDGGKSWSGRVVGKNDETWKDHYNAHPDDGGKATAERTAMHEKEIIKPAFEGKKTAKELGEKPTAILTMGGPASGKGVLLGKLAGERDLKNFVHVDPDEVKGKLPEYKASVPKDPSKGVTFRGAAAQVHVESSAVAKEIRDRAIEKGHHLIVDGTGGNAKNFTALMDRLQKAGYDVHVHYPHLDVDTGLERANSRAERVGREVPSAFIRETYGKIAEALPSIRDQAPNFHTYDAGTKGHPLVSRHVNGKKQ